MQQRSLIELSIVVSSAAVRHVSSPSIQNEYFIARSPINIRLNGLRRIRERQRRARALVDGSGKAQNVAPLKMKIKLLRNGITANDPMET